MILFGVISLGFTEKAAAQCPPATLGGYSSTTYSYGGTGTIVDPITSCTITYEYCWRETPDGLHDIFIYNVQFSNSQDCSFYENNVGAAYDAAASDVILNEDPWGDFGDIPVCSPFSPEYSECVYRKGHTSCISEYWNPFPPYNVEIEECDVHADEYYCSKSYRYCRYFLNGRWYLEPDFVDNSKPEDCEGTSYPSNRECISICE